MDRENSMSCNKKMKIKVFVSNGWNKLCEVRCGWWKGNGKDKYICNKCFK